jgi:hypothetical protein
MREIMLDRRFAYIRLLSIGLLCLCGIMLLGPAKADDAMHPAGSADSTFASADLLTKWFAISGAAKESQPHWMTPLVTVTPRLEQEYRYDQTWQARKNDVNFDNYDSGKGLEIIPTAHTEFIIGAPAYQVKTTPKGGTEGWLDETVLGKYRFVAGNEENGNYIVTGFLGYSFPTGSQAFSSDKGIVTPTRNRLAPSPPGIPACRCMSSANSGLRSKPAACGIETATTPARTSWRSPRAL